eukprot:6038824-Amphidinium_carterae.1
MDESMSRVDKPRLVRVDALDDGVVEIDVELEVDVGVDVDGVDKLELVLIDVLVDELADVIEQSSTSRNEEPCTPAHKAKQPATISEYIEDIDRPRLDELEFVE